MIRPLFLLILFIGAVIYYPTSWVLYLIFIINNTIIYFMTIFYKEILVEKVIKDSFNIPFKMAAYNIVNQIVCVGPIVMLYLNFNNNTFILLPLLVLHGVLDIESNKIFDRILNKK